MEIDKPTSPAVEQLLRQYRHLVTLPDGVRVCLRPLTPKDSDELVALFSSLPAEELQYFRSNVANPTVVAAWAEQPDYSSIFPLIAVVGDRIVGNSTLHLGKGFTRHTAEIRIFLAKDFRRHGIGSVMIKTQLEIARIEEQRNLPDIAILDRAVPPIIRDSPHRKRLVLNWMAGAFLVAMVYALASDSIRTLRRGTP